MNTQVNFELAKLLKEKGFDETSLNFYTNPRCKMFGIDEHGRYYPIKNKAKTLWVSGHAATLDSKHVYYAPTIAEVVIWLYEKHGIWISVNLKFKYQIETKKHGVLHTKDEFNSPTEAYEAAITYVLNNLL